MDLSLLLLFTHENGASDLHLSAGTRPMVRVHGEMRHLTQPDGSELPVLDGADLREMLDAILTPDQRDTLDSERELDLALSVGEEARFRGNVFFQARGLAAVFRVVPNGIRTAEELGLPEAICRLADLRKGLVLVTGPTGSGKSTTLAALVDRINESRRGHIVTIEDPIEFVHTPKQCMVNQREVGKHTGSFANALRSALREDPDVILVGEMRDLETIELALTAAETGHLVFGTLHTAGAAKTLDRVVNVFPAGEQAQIRAMFADSIQAIICQELLPRKDGSGRVAAQEILVATQALRAMIREGRHHQVPSALQTGARFGMQSMEQAIAALSTQGIIAREVAARYLAGADPTRRLERSGQEDPTEDEGSRSGTEIRGRFGQDAAGSRQAPRPRRLARRA